MFQFAETGSLLMIISRCYLRPMYIIRCWFLLHRVVFVLHVTLLSLIDLKVFCFYYIMFLWSVCYHLVSWCTCCWLFHFFNFHSLAVNWFILVLISAMKWKFRIMCNNLSTNFILFYLVIVLNYSGFQLLLTWSAHKKYHREHYKHFVDSHTLDKMTMWPGSDRG